MNTLLPLFASSQDPTKVSTTVSGFIIGYSSFIVLFAGTVFHITLNSTSVMELGTDLGYIAAAITIIVGFSHKMIQKYGKATPPQAMVAAQNPGS